MKAALLYNYDTTLSSPDYVKLEEVPEPKLLNDTDVLVRIGGAGVCRTDLHVIEGIWSQKVEVKLPYIMGHENAGWVEEIGKGVQGFRRGDPVICHPLISNCHALEARRGHDMHVEGSEFPGISTNGGYAELLRTGVSSLIKLPQTLAPKDVAPQADAGLTAYHAAKKAAAHLVPGEKVVLGRNPYWYGVDQENHRLPYLSEVIFLSVPDQDAADLKFRSGELHGLDNVKPENYRWYQDHQQEGNFTLYDLGPDMNTNFFWFNLNRVQLQYNMYNQRLLQAHHLSRFGINQHDKRYSTHLLKSGQTHINKMLAKTP